MKAGAVLVAPLAIVALVLGVVLFGDEPEAAAVPSGGSGTLNVEAVPEPYREALTAAGTRCEAITAPVLAAQIEAESNWDPTATSPAGARGLSQFMPNTWARWGRDYSGDGVANVLDPLDAIGSQADYMCHLSAWVDDQLAAAAITGDRLQLTLAAYNAGPGNVQQAGGIPAFAETRAYVERILGLVPKYTATTSIDPGGGPPVSKDGTFREILDGSGRLDPSTLCHLPWAASSMVLRCDAAAQLEALNTEFRAAFGEDLAITSAYRDYPSQVAVYAAKPHLAAKPGTSNHGWGLAVDLGNIGAEGSARHAWLRANAPAYGWQHPSWARIGGSKPEAWHWEFVGTP